MKERLTLQVAPTGSVVEAQLFPVMAKSLAFAAVSTTEVRVTAWLPVLVTVTVWALLLLRSACVTKFSECGEKVMVRGDWPTPISGTLLGDPAELLGMFRMAVLVPVAVGANERLMVQLADVASVAG